LAGLAGEDVDAGDVAGDGPDRRGDAAEGTRAVRHPEADPGKHVQPLPTRRRRSARRAHHPPSCAPHVPGVFHALNNLRARAGSVATVTTGADRASAPDRGTLRRWRDLLASEREAAMLYDRLADTAGG